VLSIQRRGCPASFYAADKKGNEDHEVDALTVYLLEKTMGKKGKREAGPGVGFENTHSAPEKEGKI